MNAHQVLVKAAALLSTTIGLAASATDVHLHYSSLAWSDSGESLRGTMRIEVRNIGAAQIRNVDVSLAHPGADAIERNLLQLGTIPAGGLKSGDVGFEISARSSTPLFWRVRYDKDDGFREAVILGEPQTGERP